MFLGAVRVCVPGGSEGVRVCVSSVNQSCGPHQEQSVDVAGLLLLRNCLYNSVCSGVNLHGGGENIQNLTVII